MILVCIGYDDCEAVAYHVLCQSIIEKTRKPVAFIPIKASMIPQYSRPRDPRQSNEFSFTRFMVPYLMGYRGWAIFMDLDMLARVSIEELWALRDSDYSVLVAQHDYTPRDKIKYLGNIQYPYPRKNWSSVMLFNCGHEHCMRLSPQYINFSKGEDLHRFNWTDKVGSLPLDYNWLVGEYDHNPDARIAHFTVGGPWFDEYTECDYSEEWLAMRGKTFHAIQTDELRATTGTDRG